MEDLVASSGDYLYVIKTVNIHSEQLKLVNLDFLTLVTTSSLRFW